jgi:pilus assembly protein Flp/PilA
VSDLLTPTACLVRLQNRSQVLLDTLADRRRSERGASVVEYGLIIALIALVAVIGIRFLGGRLSSSYSNSANVYPS